MTKQPGAKEYFERHDPDLILTDYEKGKIFELMEGYAASKPYSPEVARWIIDIGNALDEGDLLRAQHIIGYECIGASKSAWAEMERIAKEK